VSQHLTMRVAGHQERWDGTVCQLASDNSSCLELDSVLAGQRRPRPGSARSLVATAWSFRWPCRPRARPRRRAKASSMARPAGDQFNVDCPGRRVGLVRDYVIPLSVRMEIALGRHSRAVSTPVHGRCLQHGQRSTTSALSVQRHQGPRGNRAGMNCDRATSMIIRVS
jgi:hypothetical protein